MARTRKPQVSLENLFFSTPQQKLVRFLLSEPGASFSPRVISSKLKGIRGLGGVDGIAKILKDLHMLGLIDYVDNQRAVRLREDCPTISALTTLVALCELEGLKAMLAPLSSKGILYGSKTDGRARTESEYDLCVVTDSPDEVKRATVRHPMGRLVALQAFTPDDYNVIESRNPSLAQKLSRGIVVWGTTW